MTLLSGFGQIGDEIGFSFARLAGNITDIQLLEQELKRVRIAINAELRGGISGFLVKPVDFIGDSIEELREEEQRIVNEIAAINDRLGFTKIEIDPPSSGGGRGGADTIDPELLEKQNEFLAGLANTNAELEIAARLGDAAAEALARYATEQEIIALQLTPAQAAAARTLTESIIAQNDAIERQGRLIEQSEFIEQLEQQEERLRIQAESGENAAAALRLYDTELKAIATGAGPDFVDLALDIAEGINAQAEALQRAQNQAADLDLISSLEEELELIRLGNRARAQEIAVRQLSAEATQEQIDAVRELAGELFDEQERLKTQTDFLESIADQAARNIQDTFADFLFDPFEDGLEGLVTGFANALRRMAAEALAANIFGSLFSESSSGGLGDILFGLLGGNRQHGGGVRTDQAFLVGENGPELFRPPTAGSIIPNTHLAPMMAAPPEVNITNVNAIDDRSVVAAFNRGGGEQMFMNYISTNRDAIAEQLGVRR